MGKNAQREVQKNSNQGRQKREMDAGIAESSPQSSVITAQLRLNGPSREQTGPTCQVRQFQMWRDDERQTERLEAGGQRRRSDLCVKHINCRMSRNDERRPERGMDGGRDR